MTDYKPGQLAKATVRGVPDVTVTRTCSSWTTATAVGPTGGFYTHSGRHVTDIRPLVVLDLDAEQARTLGGFLRGTVESTPQRFLSEVADQIEEQLRPAIEEPKGLGAVVEGREDNRWVRTNESVGFPWRKVGAVDRVTNWAGIDAYHPVRVLSEGVPA